MQYLFGDTDVAARRLELLAEIFAQSTRPFLCEQVSRKPMLALDLGCGPGFTTHLLAEVTGCAQAVGLDNSERFIALADRTRTEGVRFVQHDVTSVPFPDGPADLLFCRFLLTHQNDPAALLGKWGTQLRPGGLLLLEETDSIRTSNATFEAYIDIVERLLEAQGKSLWAGRRLADMDGADGLEVRSNAVAHLRVPTARAAALFRMNMQTWKTTELARKTLSPEELAALGGELEALMAAPASDVPAEWGLRQMALARL
jgi:trans-aconitate 2-methyltransferase